MTGPHEDPTGAAIVERVIELGHRLHANGVPISLAEIIDAAHAMQHVDLGAREQVRFALRSTLVKDPQHFGFFDDWFARLFPPRTLAGLGAVPRADPDDDPWLQLASDADLGGLAAVLVDQFAGLDGELRGEVHHVRRAYRGADLARLMSETRKKYPDLASPELRARVDELKRLMAAEIRSRVGEPSPDEVVGPLEDIDFLHASRAELDRVRAAVRPLARRIAGRLARKRHRQHAGKVNVRRTARRSISAGGVPIDVAHDRRRAHRPELFVLCDISGSVAEFSVFTLTLMAALSAEMAHTRSFVFVDGIDEITELLAATGHAIEPWQILRNTNVIADDGHSDYGSVFAQFWHYYGETQLRPSATVLIAGDGRTNYRADGCEHLREIARRAKRVYWLNPEPRDEWDTHDSAMSRYADCCTKVFEVRTVRQLIDCVERLI